MTTVWTEMDSIETCVRRVPSWFASLALHVCLLLLFVQIPMIRAVQIELPPVVVNTVADPDTKIEPPRIDPPKDIPITDNPVFLSDKVLDDPLGSEFVFDDELPGAWQDPTDPDPRLVSKDSLDLIAVRVPVGPPKSYDPVVKRRPPVGLGSTSGGPASDDPALIWLANAQELDGHWDSRKWGAGGDYDVGCTGLALCAFLARGHSDREGKYSYNMALGLRWLRLHQKDNGDFGCPRFYGQGIATMACCDAYGMAGTPWVGRMAQKGIDYIVKVQPDDGGFDYTGSGGEHNDTSITGWQIMALKSGRLVGMDVPDAAFEKANRYLRESINPDGTTGYRKTQRPNPAMTSVGLLCRLLLGWDKNHPDCRRATEHLVKTGPDIDNVYYCYYATFAFQQMGGKDWFDWQKQLFHRLRGSQVHGRGSQLDGSWDPDNTWGKAGGRVYSTAMTSLVLATPFRFPALSR